MRNSLLLASISTVLLAIGCSQGSNDQASTTPPSTTTTTGTAPAPPPASDSTTTTTTTGTTPAPAGSAKGFTAVAAIMTSSCMPCHSEKAHRAGLDLSSYDSLMKGSRSGKVVVAGDPKTSLLVQFLTGDKKPRMPQGRAPLSDAEMKTVTDWIQSGAKND